MSNTHAYLRVRLAHDWYGIEVNHVVEVLYILALNELPAARPDVLGLMRLRNLVIPVIDLRLCFGQSAAYMLTTPIIVVTAHSKVMGLVVDEVHNLASIEATDITTQDTNLSRYVSSVARVPEGLLLLLDVIQLEAGHEIQVLRNMNRTIRQNISPNSICVILSTLDLKGLLRWQGSDYIE